MITDRFGRIHDYLRISLTDNCNLRCFYCMPEEDHSFTPSAKLMQPQEIYQLAKMFTEQGVRKIRLTGGEPLVRKDAAEIISMLGTLPVELVITSNGTRVDQHLDTLRNAGIRSINISLDTLQPDKFQLMTRRDQFHLVRSNIELLLHHGFRVRINVVAMKGMNDQEINDFIAWTRHSPVEIRFIEFMPFQGNRWTSNQVLGLDEMLQIISQQYEVLPVQGDPHDTARRYMIPGHTGSFAVISTMTKPFCAGCNRMRLTADGRLKNCLFSTGETDLLTPLRAGQDPLPLIFSNIATKERELGGQFTTAIDQINAIGLQNRSMISIGG